MYIPKTGDKIRVIAIPETVKATDSVYPILQQMIKSGKEYEIQRVDRTNPDYVLVEIEEVTVEDGVEVYNFVLIETDCISKNN